MSDAQVLLSIWVECWELRSWSLLLPFPGKKTCGNMDFSVCVAVYSFIEDYLPLTNTSALLS